MNAADRKKANKLFTQLGAESLPTSSQIKKIRYSNVVKQLDKAYELKKELNKLEGQMTTKELQGRFTRSTTDDSAHRKQIRELENRLNKLNGLEHYNEEDTEEEIEEELYQPSRKSSRAAGGGGRGSGSSLQTEMRLPNPPTTQVRGVSRARAGPPGQFG